MGHEVFVAQPDLSSFIVQRDVVHAVKELIEIVLVWKLSFPHRHTIDWDRPTLGTGPLLGQALGTGPLLGQAHSWYRPILGTGPFLGLSFKMLGSSPPLCQFSRGAGYILLLLRFDILLLLSLWRCRQLRIYCSISRDFLATPLASLLMTSCSQWPGTSDALLNVAVDQARLG